MLDPHEEMEHFPLCSAAEAVKELLFRIDVERRRLLSVKRVKPPESASRTCKLHVPGDDLDAVGALSHVVNQVVRQVARHWRPPRSHSLRVRQGEGISSPFSPGRQTGVWQPLPTPPTSSDR